MLLLLLRPLHIQRRFGGKIYGKNISINLTEEISKSNDSVEVINRMGAVSVNLSGGEVINSLKLGVLDAAEWAGPWPDMTMGFHKVAKYYYGPGIHEPSSVLECSINLDAYNSLPKDLKSIVQFACEAENNRMLSEFTAANSDAQQKLVNAHNVEVLNFPKKVFKEMINISNDVVAETANQGNINKQIYNSWNKFKSIARLRAPFAEHGFINLSS